MICIFFAQVRGEPGAERGLPRLSRGGRRRLGRHLRPAAAQGGRGRRRRRRRRPQRQDRRGQEGRGQEGRGQGQEGGRGGQEGQEGGRGGGEAGGAAREPLRPQDAGPPTPRRTRPASVCKGGRATPLRTDASRQPRGATKAKLERPTVNGLSRSQEQLSSGRCLLWKSASWHPRRAAAPRRADGRAPASRPPRRSSASCGWTATRCVAGPARACASLQVSARRLTLAEVPLLESDAAAHSLGPRRPGSAPQMAAGRPGAERRPGQLAPKSWVCWVPGLDERGPAAREPGENPALAQRTNPNTRDLEAHAPALSHEHLQAVCARRAARPNERNVPSPRDTFIIGTCVAARTPGGSSSRRG